MSRNSSTTRHIGSACRIYKNSDNKVIAIDEISLAGDIRKITTTTYHMGSQQEVSRTLFHLANNNRVVDTIQMIGDYTSIEYDSGNLTSAIWNQSDDVNNVKATFLNVAMIGDTI